LKTITNNLLSIPNCLIKPLNRSRPHFETIFKFFQIIFPHIDRYPKKNDEISSLQSYSPSNGYLIVGKLDCNIPSCLYYIYFLVSLLFFISRLSFRESNQSSRHPFSIRDQPSRAVAFPVPTETNRSSSFTCSPTKKTALSVYHFIAQQTSIVGAQSLLPDEICFLIMLLVLE